MFSNLSSLGPYITTTQLAVPLASFLLVYGIYKIFAFVYDELTSPLRHVPGPPSPSFIYGSVKQLAESVRRNFALSHRDCLNEQIMNRIMILCRRTGSTNMARQSNSKIFSEWVDDYYQPVLSSDSDFFSQSRLVLWLRIWKQPITCFSIVMTIRNRRWSGDFFKDSLEVVRFVVYFRGYFNDVTTILYRNSNCWRKWA